MHAFCCLTWILIFLLKGFTHLATVRVITAQLVCAWLEMHEFTRCEDSDLDSHHTTGGPSRGHGCSSTFWKHMETFGLIFGSEVRSQWFQIPSDPQKFPKIDGSKPWGRKTMNGRTLSTWTIATSWTFITRSP